MQGMNCPRCFIPLVEGALSSELIAHGCRGCGGVWLVNEASQRVIAGMGQQAFDRLRAHTKAARHGVDTKRAGLLCPECRQMLRRTTVTEARLELDVCSSHGTWFDCGEVERVALAFDKELASDWRNAPKPLPAPANSDGMEDLDHRDPFVIGFTNVMSAFAEANEILDPEIRIGPLVVGHVDDEP